MRRGMACFLLQACFPAEVLSRLVNCIYYPWRFLKTRGRMGVIEWFREYS